MAMYQSPVSVGQMNAFFSIIMSMHRLTWFIKSKLLPLLCASRVALHHVCLLRWKEFLCHEHVDIVSIDLKTESNHANFNDWSSEEATQRTIQCHGLDVVVQLEFVIGKAVFPNLIQILGSNRKFSSA
jgi:hypothetical protein